jgi:hypothetical protein
MNAQIDLTLDQLAELWRQTKAAEDQHRKDRIDLECAMLKITGGRDEGSETTRTDHYKITTTGRLSRVMDWKKWDEQVAEHVPTDLHPVKTERKLDVKGCKWLELNEPDIWRIVAQCIATKPGKTGFRIEPIDEAKR